MQAIELVRNLNQLYKPALNEKQEGFYLEFLMRYTEDQLDELWFAAMHTHTVSAPPTIGRLKEYAKQVTPVRIISHEEIERDAVKRLTNEEIFATSLGKLSLVQGWADSYRMECKETGIPEQGDETLIKFQRGQSDANNAARELEGKTDIFSKTLLNMRKSMVIKNQFWKEEFAHLVEVPQRLN
jgi:hypothetical protein